MQLSTNAESCHAKAFTFEYWSGGGDLKNIRELHVELACRLVQVAAGHGKEQAEDVDDIFARHILLG